MDIWGMFLFVIPLIPLIHATIQDWKDKEIDAILIVCVATFGFFVKCVLFPESIISSLVFGLFAFSIGIGIAEFEGWTIADALMLGAIGLCVQPIDYYMFFFITLVTLVTLNVCYKLRWRKKTGLELDGIYTILITFIAYTIAVI